jgi:hypothetical protein
MVGGFLEVDPSLSRPEWGWLAMSSLMRGSEAQMIRSPVQGRLLDSTVSCTSLCAVQLQH